MGRKKKNTDDFNIEKEYDKAVVNIGKLKSKIRTLQREVSQRDRIIEIQDDEIELNDNLRKSEHQQPIIIQHNPSISKNEIVPIVNIGDMHVESVINPDVVLGLNKSNPDIIASRMKYACNKALSMLNYISKEMPFSKIVIQFMGDNITNYIHEELLKTNALSPFQATEAARNIITDFIKQFASNRNEQIDIVCIIGNHSRNAKKKEYNSRHTNSFEYWLYNDIIDYFIKHSIGYNNVTFHFEPSEFTVLKIFDKTITTSHGDHWLYAGGIGGLQIPAMKWDYQMQRTIPADRRYTGHWHTYLSLKRILISSSICGYDAFALAHKFEYEPPSINIDICHKEHGFIQNRLIVLPTYL